jgi:S-adenosylmethionine:tRNA ribosyltransferase-isomerase
VGAGTFQPIEVEDARQHRMHTERVEWSLEALEELTLALETHRPIIPVGTTSLRSLESLLLLQPGQNQVSQWAGWESLQQASPVERIQLHCQELKKRNLKQLVFETSLMIAPGFPKLHADALITNFHQPGSTLLFLVSAFSDSNWKFAYEYALNHDYQFLSFGDSSFWIHPHSKAYFPKR